MSVTCIMMFAFRAGDSCDAIDVRKGRVEQRAWVKNDIEEISDKTHRLASKGIAESK